MHPNRVALVTGANQGIGLQIVKDLARAGITVFLGSRNLERGVDAARGVAGEVRPIQLDVTDPASIAAATARIRNEVGRLDILINNAAISRTQAAPGQTLAEHAAETRPSNVPFAELRAVWETNVFGPLAVYQAMLPLLREAPFASIVNVSSGMGSLTLSQDPATYWRPYFGPTYAASKTALNALTLAMSIELEGTPIKVNAVSPGYTRTNLNGYAGTESVEEGAVEAVRVALLGPDGPTGQFTHATMGRLPW